MRLTGRAVSAINNVKENQAGNAFYITGSALVNWMELFHLKDRSKMLQRHNYSENKILTTSEDELESKHINHARYFTVFPKRFSFLGIKILQVNLDLH